ncbi:hypothetical protein J1N35_029700 [Gossypium stocksii]|uniref:Uncharacterized protein n=1 Tax=Gossypium stocksii TaxID=47602 RepID=A0A9D3UY93_9ROSI|nr:hypothetical protein J1N35_029700 [Gossypium stocksii]
MTQCTSFNYQQKFPLSGYAKFKEPNHNLENPPLRLGTSNEALAHRPNLTSCHPELPLIVIVIVKDISGNYFILVLLVLAAAGGLGVSAAQIGKACGALVIAVVRGLPITFS